MSIQLGFDPVARAQVYICVFEDFMSMLNKISDPRDQDSAYQFFDAEKTSTLRAICHGLNQPADDKVVLEVVLAQRDGEYK